MTDGKSSYCGDHLIMYTNIESQCGTHKINIILYVNYNLIKNFVE